MDTTPETAGKPAQAQGIVLMAGEADTVAAPLASLGRVPGTGL